MSTLPLSVISVLLAVAVLVIMIQGQIEVYFERA